jgi:hypothetical protein
MVDYIPIAEISSVTFEVAQKPSSEDTKWRQASSRTQVAFSLLLSPYFHRVLSYHLRPHILYVYIPASFLVCCPQDACKHLIEDSKHDFCMFFLAHLSCWRALRSFLNTSKDQPS